MNMLLDYLIDNTKLNEIKVWLHSLHIRIIDTRHAMATVDPTADIESSINRCKTEAIK